MLGTVVVIALLLAWWNRAERLRRMAAEHADEARHVAGAAWGVQRLGGFSPDDEPVAQHYWRLYAHHLNLSQQYRQAVWRPWMSIREEPTPELEQSEVGREAHGS